MSKNAIVVTNIGFDHVFKFTKPYFEQYSNKVGAEFITIDRNSVNVTTKNYQHLRFENFQVYKYFDNFDRILLLDCDTLIKPNCPNYFELDEDYVYVTRVDTYKPHQGICYSKIINTQEQLGQIVSWVDFYFNSGVMLLSKHHKELFNLDLPMMEKVTGKTRVQDYLNWKIQKLRFMVKDLGPKFNYFKTVNSINTVERKNANILHYPGPKEVGSVNLKLIERDSLSFKEKVLY